MSKLEREFYSAPGPVSALFEEWEEHGLAEELRGFAQEYLDAHPGGTLGLAEHHAIGMWLQSIPEWDGELD